MRLCGWGTSHVVLCSPDLLTQDNKAGSGISPTLQKPHFPQPFRSVPICLFSSYAENPTPALLPTSEKRKLKASVAQSCLTLCDPMDISPPGSSVRGIIPLGALEWAAIPFSRGSSPPGIKPGSSALQADSSPPEALPSYPVSPSRGLYSVGLMK